MTATHPRMAGLGPDDIERLHAAARAIRDRNPAQAERLIYQVLARHPGHPEAQRLLAIVQLHTQRVPQAIANLQLAITQHPDDALLHADLGNALNAYGEQDAAIATGGTRERRVILATNIAETSLTLPRIKYVVDTGLARMSRYAPRTRTKRLLVKPHLQQGPAAAQGAATGRPRGRAAAT